MRHQKPIKLISLEKENSILITCARTTLDEANQTRLVSLTKNDIAWDKLIKLGRHHRLLPLLHKHLAENCPENVPAKISTFLSNFYRQNSLQNLKKLAALHDIFKLFAKHAIPALTLKGPLLTSQYLGNIAYRSFGDIDIVVKQNDLIKSIGLLQEAGYHLYPETLPAQFFYKFAKLHHHARVTKENGVLVEMHWRLSSHYGARNLDYQTLLPHVEICDVQGCQFPTLSPEMLLIYLAIHGQKHCWQQYDFLLCIAEVLNHTPAMKWQTVAEIAEMLRIEKVVAFSIFMAVQLLDAAVDGKVLESFKHHVGFAQLLLEHKQNWHHINQVVANRTRVKEGEWIIIYPLKLRRINNIQDIIRIYYRQNFIPSETDWAAYPVSFPLHGIYYITRPAGKLFRLLCRSFQKATNRGYR